MNDNLRVSKQGLDLIKEFEGFFSSAYYCPAGVLTIGYGHTNLSGELPKVTKSLTMTKDEATALLSKVLAKVYEPDVRKLVKVPLTQNQYDALVSFCYNLGGGNLGKSTLLKRVNAKDFAGAAAQFAVWNKASGKVLNGLTRRRAAEAKMFLGKGNVTPVPVATPTADKPATSKVDPVAATGGLLNAIYKAIQFVFKRKS